MKRERANSVALPPTSSEPHQTEKVSFLNVLSQDDCAATGIL